MDVSTIVVLIIAVAVFIALAAKRNADSGGAAKSALGSSQASSAAQGGIHTEFRQAIHDKRVRDRLLGAEMAKNPQLSEEQCIERVLESYRRDRR